MSMEFGLLLQLNAILTRLSHVYFYTVYSKRIYPSFSCHLRLHNWQQEIKWYVTWVTKRKSMMRHTKKEKKTTNLVTHKKKWIILIFRFQDAIYLWALASISIHHISGCDGIHWYDHAWLFCVRFIYWDFDPFARDDSIGSINRYNVFLNRKHQINDSPVFISAVVLVIRW